VHLLDLPLQEHEGRSPVDLGVEGFHVAAIVLFRVLATFAGAVDCDAGALIDGQAVRILGIAEACYLCIHVLKSPCWFLRASLDPLVSQVLGSFAAPFLFVSMLELYHAFMNLSMLYRAFWREY